MIPTADEFLTTYADDDLLISREVTLKCMIEFTKLHVEAALKAASKTKVKTVKGNPILQRDGHDVNQILNAYDLNQIK